jgi:hypothetical protein
MTHSAYIDDEIDCYSKEMDELFEIEAEDRKRESWFFQY